MKNSKFDIDLKAAQVSEAWVTSIVDGSLKIEVKHDIKVDIYGNLYFEIINNDGFTPSGICVAEVQLWAHRLGKVPYVTLFCDFKILKKVVLDYAESHPKSVKKGGPVSEGTTGVCIPESEFLVLMRNESLRTR
jgi:hypothetical protein